MKSKLLILLIVASIKTFAQQDSLKMKENIVLDKIEIIEHPWFYGGADALNKYLSKNLQYPQKSTQK
jgi:hypothetical protein